MCTLHCIRCCFGFHYSTLSITTKRQVYEKEHGCHRQDHPHTGSGCHCRSLFRQHHYRHTGHCADGTGNSLPADQPRWLLPAICHLRHEHLRREEIAFAGGKRPGTLKKGGWLAATLLFTSLSLLSSARSLQLFVIYDHLLVLIRNIHPLVYQQH